MLSRRCCQETWLKATEQTKNTMAQQLRVSRL
jgi:hypothetical protein